MGLLSSVISKPSATAIGIVMTELPCFDFYGARPIIVCFSVDTARYDYSCLNVHLISFVIMPNIRKAEPTDIESCARLLNILFSQEHEFTPDQRKQEAGLGMIIGNPSVGTVFVCESEKGIIGMVILLNMVSTALGKKVVMLEDMIVEPAWRSKGIGALLLEHASRWARNEGYGRITLLTDGDNVPAHHFYEDHGFVRSSMVAYRKRL